MAPKKTKSTDSTSIPQPSDPSTHGNIIEKSLKTLSPYKYCLNTLIDLRTDFKGLGPAFLDEAPSSISPFYPSADILPFLQTFPPNKNDSLPHFHFRTWHSPNDAWINWVDRVGAVKGEVWKDCGIYDAIQLSKTNIAQDRALMIAAMFNWSTTTNSLHLKCGMMAPTIQDVCYLTGLKPFGIDVSTLLVEEDSPFIFPSKQTGTKSSESSYGKYLTSTMDPRVPVNDAEHIAFLLAWLNKFLLCVPAFQVTKDFIHVAVALSRGKHLALAPLVLSHLYRGIYDLLISNFGRCGGPLWYFQIWLQVYFPELGPVVRPSANDPLLSVSYASAVPKSHSFGDCFNFFYSGCEQRTISQFLPFSHYSQAPRWLTPPQGVSTKKLADKHSAMWASFLLSRDLHFNTGPLGTVNSKVGIEFYNPNQLARQFGLT
ncbi:uncharacterized protein LOC132316243 [Cornus florida]|uniref:uncharacterized protein LOC132316243 n=1 Tax=Cornus florida TaxID=4283 RepID=UPI002899D727|nr:uncharacterized protein LOC132316243 [Cornus florida]